MAPDENPRRIRIPELEEPRVVADLKALDPAWEQEIAEARAQQMTPEERAYLEREIAAFTQMGARQVEQLDEHTRSEHAEAARVCREYNEHGRPFGLFLRSFAVEATAREPGPDEVEYTSRIVTIRPHRDVEDRLVEWLAASLPVIAVANPVDRSPQGNVPHLHLSVEDWKDVVDDLVEAASAIVMQVEGSSGGVHYELDTIQRAAKESETVVVLSEPPTDPLVGATGPAMTPDDPAVRRFPRVVTAAEVEAAGDDLGSLTALQGLRFGGS